MTSGIVPFAQAQTVIWYKNPILGPTHCFCALNSAAALVQLSGLTALGSHQT